MGALVDSADRAEDLSLAHVTYTVGDRLEYTGPVFGLIIGTGDVGIVMPGARCSPDCSRIGYRRRHGLKCSMRAAGTAH